MADSTLSLTYVDLMNAASYFGHGEADYTDTTDAEQVMLDRIVNNGYRQFLYPLASEGIEAGYEWSFLRPSTTLDTAEDDAEQDLPDDFGRLIDGFTFEADAQVPSILADVGEGKIRKLRERIDESGRPRVAAIRIKAGTGALGQRREVMWYPIPDDAYPLGYKYAALINKLTTENLYPVGSMKHGETLRLSILAMASATLNDERGPHWDDFVRALAGSIARDKKEGAKFFGNVGTHGEYEESSGRSSFPYTLTVSGYEIQT